MNVAIAPAESSRTSATAASTESGSAERRKSPPDTGGITATSSPSLERLGSIDVRSVARVEEPARLVAELERGPDVRRPSRPSASSSSTAPDPARSRSAANNLTLHLHDAERYPPVASRPRDMLWSRTCPADAHRERTSTSGSTTSCEQRVLARRSRLGREAEPARARRRARRLPQPGAPRAHAARRRGPAHRAGRGAGTTSRR
mgnify:CR=1 FL=1